MVVDDFFFAKNHVAYPVIGDDGDFRGLLRLEHLKELPREKWPYITAGDLAAHARYRRRKHRCRPSQPNTRCADCWPRTMGRLAVVIGGRWWESSRGTTCSTL